MLLIIPNPTGGRWWYNILTWLWNINSVELSLFPFFPLYSLFWCIIICLAAHFLLLCFFSLFPQFSSSSLLLSILASWLCSEQKVQLKDWRKEKEPEEKWKQNSVEHQKFGKKTDDKDQWKVELWWFCNKRFNLNPMKTKKIISSEFQ